LEKITTEGELSGLLNLALKALKGLLERGDFSYSKTVEEIREDYLRKSSPVYAFVTDCLEVDSDALIEKKMLFNLFGFYCRALNIPSVTQQTFFKNLPRFVFVRDMRPEIEGKRPTCFRGVRLSLNLFSVASTISKEISEKEAQNEPQSTMSTMSIFFYTFTYREDEMKKMGYSVEPINDEYVKVIVPFKKEEYEEDDKARKRIEVVESPEYVYYYRQIKPSERCRYCSQFPVEFLIKTEWGTILRKCRSCFDDMRKKFTKVKFIRSDF